MEVNGRVLRLLMAVTAMLSSRVPARTQPAAAFSRAVLRGFPQDVSDSLRAGNGEAVTCLQWSKSGFVSCQKKKIMCFDVFCSAEVVSVLFPSEVYENPAQMMREFLMNWAESW